MHAPGLQQDAGVNEFEKCWNGLAQVAVVSAMGSHPTSPLKVTDLLLKMVDRASRRDQSFLLDLAAIQASQLTPDSALQLRDLCFVIRPMLMLSAELAFLPSCRSGMVIRILSGSVPPFCGGSLESGLPQARLLTTVPECEL